MLLNCGVGEDSWESLELQGDPIHPKKGQLWVFIGKTDVETETPILWPTYANSWLIGKDSDARKDWRWKEKGLTEDEMVRWPQWLNMSLIWVWVNSGSWWWSERPGVLQSMGSQRVGHNWVTELNWTELNRNSVELTLSCASLTHCNSLEESLLCLTWEQFLLWQCFL